MIKMFTSYDEKVTYVRKLAHLMEIFELVCHNHLLPVYSVAQAHCQHKITKRASSTTDRESKGHMLFGSSKKSKKATAEAPAAPSSSSIDATKDAILATYNALLQSTGSEDSEEYLDPDLLTMEHIGKLCEQLNVDPSADVRVLVMLWRLGAVSTPGCITKTEFIAGFRKLRVSSLAELRSQLPSFDPGFLEKTEFRGELSMIQVIGSC